MSIWGKIVGAAAGLAMGGPLGAVLGVLAGHYAMDRDVDRMPRDGEPFDAPADTGRVAFTIGVIALGAKMAKADGVVTRDEINAFKQVFQIPPEEAGNFSRVFNLVRRDVAGYEQYARQIAAMFRDRPHVLEELLDGLFHIAKADGVFHPNEENYLRSVASIFGFTDGDWARIRAGHVGPDAGDPYVILGVTRDVSDTELKKVYRAMVSANHPDRLIAQGMPEEFVTVANGKVATINDAYDRIAKQRGIN